MPAYVGQVLQHSQIYFMLRGGAKYNLFTPNRSNGVTIYTTKTNIAHNTGYTVYLEPTKTPKNDYAEAKGSTIAGWCDTNNKTLINGGKIYTGSVTATQIAANAITTEKIAANAVNADKIAASAITSAKIAANAVTSDKIVANAVTAAKIASKTITANQISANSITAAELSVSTLSAISANLGTVTAGVLKSSNYVANSTGMMLNLATGTWDSKYFKISSTGGITSTSGKIACWDITGEALKNDYLAPDGYLRRVYIQGSKNTGDWIFSIQKGATQGASPSTLNSLWHVTNDGEMSFNVESGKGIKMYGLAGLEVSVLRDGIELWHKPNNTAYTKIGKGYVQICSSGTRYYDGCALSAIGGVKTDGLNIWHSSWNRWCGAILNRTPRNEIGLDWDGVYLRIYVDNTIIASYHWGSASWV